MLNIYRTIQTERADSPDRTALVQDERAVSYAQLFASVEQETKRLYEEGVRAGDRVAFVGDDSIDYIITSLAILSINAVLVPVSKSLSIEELENIKNILEVDHVIHENRIEKNSRKLSRSEIYKDAAFIRFSSGTTGTSKGVMLTHRAIIERTDAADKGLRITDNDVVIWVLSMCYHFVVTILLFLRRGASVVLCGTELPLSLVRAMSLHKATFIYASPFHYNLMYASLDFTETMFAHVRMAVSTATALPEDIAAAFERKTGISISQAYGIIEVGLPFINDDPSGRIASVGRVLPDYEIRIVDTDDNKTGRVLLRGPGMFDAYCAPWRLRTDEWFDTGDIGYLDEEGYLFLVGRAKNVINFTGMKIFPYEVEEIINLYDGVDESLVYGIDHNVYGQIPAVKIVLSDPQHFDIKDFKRFCYVSLPAYKVPKEINIVDFLPKTQSGKLKRI